MRHRWIGRLYPLVCVAIVLSACSLEEEPEHRDRRDGGYSSDISIISSDTGTIADTSATGDDQQQLDAATDVEATDDSSIQFDDVPSTHTFAKAIEWVTRQGIMSGCEEDPPMFCPDEDLTRAGAAITLIRMKFGETFDYTETPHFSDVSANHWAFAAIQKLKDEEITSGCGDGTFCPETTVTRAVGATLLVRTTFGAEFDYTEEPHFSDVAAADWAFEYIQKLYDEAITNGCGEGTFCPADVLPRAAWAAFLYRTGTLDP